MAGEISVLPQFLGRTFEQYLAPIIEYNKVWQDIDNKYTDLLTKAAVLLKLRTDDPDSKTFLDYLRWDADLRQDSANLLYNGLTPQTRRALLGRYLAYNNVIIPSIAAITEWEEAKKRYDLLSSEERMSWNPYEMSVDDFNGSNVAIRKLNLKDILDLAYKQAAAETLRHKKLFDAAANGDIEAQKILDEQYWYLSKLYGFVNGTEDLVNEVNNALDLILALYESGYSKDINEKKNPVGLLGLENMLQGLNLRDMSNQTKADVLNTALAGYFSGLSGDIEDKFLNNVDAKSGGSDKEAIPYGKTWGWTGSEVVVNSTDNEKLDTEFEHLSKWKEANGEVPEYIVTKEYNDSAYLAIVSRLELHINSLLEKDPTWDPNSDSTVAILSAELQLYKDTHPNVPGADRYGTHDVQTKNPVYESYQKAKEKYQSEDIDYLLERNRNEKAHAVERNRYASINPADSGMVSKYLKSLLFANLDLEDDNSTNKVWFKDGKDKVDLKTLDAAFSDPDLNISILPSAGDLNDPKAGAIVLTSSKVGKPIYLDKTVLSNLRILTTAKTIDEEGRGFRMPDEVRELLPDAQLINGDQYITKMMSFYSKYRYIYNKMTAKEKKEKQYNSPSVILDALLSDLFEALRNETSRYYRIQTTTDKNENR